MLIQISREILVNKVQKVNGLLCLLTKEIDKEILEIGSNLEIVSNLAVWYNNIDIEFATKKGLW